MGATYRVMIGGALFVLASCARTPENRVGTTVTTAARTIMNDDAAMLLTNGRCQRESACDNVGRARRFEDHDACRTELFRDSYTPLRSEACPSGVDEAKLTRCLTDVRGLRCDQLQQVGDLTSCSRTALCTAP